jgi:hypothetical protein
MTQARFEAVWYDEEYGERLSEWCVVEWTSTNHVTGARSGRTVKSFTDFRYPDAEELAVELARVLQEEYNIEFAQQ